MGRSSIMRWRLWKMSRGVLNEARGDHASNGIWYGKTGGIAFRYNRGRLWGAFKC
jgi:hypothetical protein